MIVHKQSAIHQMEAALENHQFFKLIGGGSFTDAPVLERLSNLYARAGVDCIDVAPDHAILTAIERALNQLPPDVNRPAVMVSIPLDPDPHFRKIDLSQPDCILCDGCIPICPTDAITVNDNNTSLIIEQPLCYGCGRCVDVCPTQALSLHPFQVLDQIKTVLRNPMVSAVELHTRYADPYMLPAFLADYGDLLVDKMVALCFQASAIAADQYLRFIQQLQEGCPGFSILQIDGKPMSGSADPAASLPAIESARVVQHQLENNGISDLYITLSGGINDHTARYLREPQNQFIHGVGMGTFARQAVWPWLGGDVVIDDEGVPSAAVSSALAVAAPLVDGFKAGRKWAIMTTGDRVSH